MKRPKKPKVTYRFMMYDDAPNIVRLDFVWERGRWRPLNSWNRKADFRRAVRLLNEDERKRVQ